MIATLNATTSPQRRIEAPERAVVIQCLHRDICRDTARLAGDTRSNGKTRPLPLIEGTSQIEADGSVRSKSSRQTHCGNSCFPSRLKAEDATAGSECERVNSNLKRNSKPLHVNGDLMSASLITTSLKERAVYFSSSIGIIEDGTSIALNQPDCSREPCRPFTDRRGLKSEGIRKEKQICRLKTNSMPFVRNS
jgi:hypothetical protein